MYLLQMLQLFLSTSATVTKLGSSEKSKHLTFAVSVFMYVHTHSKLFFHTGQQIIFFMLNMKKKPTKEKDVYENL
jgi:hypothetical protein